MEGAHARGAQPRLGRARWAGGRSRYRAQAAGWAEGRDLAGQRTRTSRPGTMAPAAGPAGPRISPPQSSPTRRAQPKRSASGGATLRGPDTAGACSHLRPETGSSPGPSRCAHLERICGRMGGGSGRGQATGNVGAGGTGRVEEPCTWTLVAEYARVFPRQIIPDSPLFDPFTDRETEACSGAEICSQDARTGEAEPARPCPNPLWAWLLSPAPRSR